MSSLESYVSICVTVSQNESDVGPGTCKQNSKPKTLNPKPYTLNQNLLKSFL